MSTGIAIAVMLTIEIALFAFAVASRHPTRLVTFAVVNMLAVSLYAPRLLEVGGYVNNIASIFYAFVIIAQVVIFRLHGPEVSLRSVVTVFFALGMAVLINIGLNLFPPINVSFTEALAGVTDRTSRTVFASFGAYVLAMGVLVAVLSVSRVWYCTIAAIIAAQVIDSAAFYPLAFYGTNIIGPELIVTGIAFKLAWTAIAALPCWWLAHQEFRHAL